jgi:formylglycine-generating enzyme required for sulfatase activity
MDRYEYPNVAGMLPATVVTFAQARAACEAEDKRLCSEAEWAVACGGPTGLAFSYGDELDVDACNVGHPLPKMPVDALWEARDVSAAVSRVDARRRAGDGGHCVGALGVHDLVGNVEEWVTSDGGYHGALRGGAYSDPAPTCRTVRQLRDPSYRSVATGFRCCRDPLVRAGNPVAPR